MRVAEFECRAAGARLPGVPIEMEDGGGNRVLCIPIENFVDGVFRANPADPWSENPRGGGIRARRVRTRLGGIKGQHTREDAARKRQKQQWARPSRDLRKG